MSCVISKLDAYMLCVFVFYGQISRQGGSRVEVNDQESNNMDGWKVWTKLYWSSLTSATPSNSLYSRFPKNTVVNKTVAQMKRFTFLL